MLGPLWNAIRTPRLDSPRVLVVEVPLSLNRVRLFCSLACSIVQSFAGLQAASEHSCTDLSPAYSTIVRGPVEEPVSCRYSRYFGLPGNVITVPRIDSPVGGASFMASVGLSAIVLLCFALAH